MGDTNHGNGAGGAGDTGADDNKANATADEADTAKQNGAKDDAGDDAGGDAGDDDTGSDDGDDQGKGDSKKGSDDADDDTEDDEDDGEEPELRKPKHGASNAEWAAWRAQEKAKAAKSAKDTKQTDKKDKSGDDSKGDDVDDEDEDGLSPEDRAAFDKRIEKKLKPFQERAAEQEVEASIATFVKDNPDFAPFAAKAKRFAMHPSRQSVPIKSIFYEVAGDKLMRIGAQRAKQADDKAKKTKTGGGSTGGDQQGDKSYKDMPLKDFEKELEAVKTGGRR